MLPLGQILQNFNINYHSYADDTQLYVSLSPDDCSPADVLCQCLEEINSWMRENFLQLNEDKTEIILFGSKEKRVSIGKYLEMRALTITDQVRNLGVLIDSDLTFSSHIKAVTKAVTKRNINRIKGFVSKKDQEKLIIHLPKRAVNICSSSRTLLLEF